MLGVLARRSGVIGASPPLPTMEVPALLPSNPLLAFQVYNTHCSFKQIRLLTFTNPKVCILELMRVQTPRNAILHDATTMYCLRRVDAETRGRAPTVRERSGGVSRAMRAERRTTVERIERKKQDS